MKKLIALSLLSATALAVASNPKTNEQAQPQVDTRPMATIFLVDGSTKTPRIVAGKTFSRTSKIQLCWSAKNIPLTGKDTTKEEFKAPDKMNISSPGAQVSSQNNGKTVIVTTQAVKNNGKEIGRCWKFDKNDPVGKYELSLEISGTIFNGLTFEVTK